MLRDLPGNVTYLTAISPYYDRCELDTSFDQLAVSTAAREVADRVTGCSFELIGNLSNLENTPSILQFKPFEVPSLWIFFPGDLVGVFRFDPPRQSFDTILQPPNFGDSSNNGEVFLPAPHSEHPTKPGQQTVDIEKARFPQPYSFSVTASRITRRIIDESCGNRIQVNICDDLAEIVVGFDDAGLVATLPQPAEASPTSVVAARHLPLNPGHRTPQRDSPSSKDQVIVISEQAPSENRQTVKVSHLGDHFDEGVGLNLIIENVLTASCAAINVVNGVWDEKTWLPRHGFPHAAQTGCHNNLSFGH